MASNEEQRDDFVQRGMINAQRFNWNQNAAQVMNIYRQAALNKGSKRACSAEPPFLTIEN